jgi:hypothetical protein
LRNVIAALLGGVLLAGCGSATPTQAPTPTTAISTPAVPTATNDTAKRFDAALEKAGFKDAQVVADYDDKAVCTQSDPKNPRRCLKWKEGAKLVGYDSFYNVGGDCTVEVKTNLDGKAWKVDSVNGKEAVLEGSPSKDSVVTFIKNRNNANASPAGDLCNIA